MIRNFTFVGLVILAFISIRYTRDDLRCTDVYSCRILIHFAQSFKGSCFRLSLRPLALLFLHLLLLVGG